jgi:hypothetical protein
MAKKLTTKRPVPKKRRGRPRTEPTQVGLTLLPSTLMSLDRFAAQEGLTRGMAARRIIELFFEMG